MKGNLVCPVRRSASVTTVLSQLVVKNAVELLANNAKQRRASGSPGLDRVGPPVDPTELVTALETAVKDEINVLAIEKPDLTLVMSDRVVAGAADAEQVSRTKALSTGHRRGNEQLAILAD